MKDMRDSAGEETSVRPAHRGDVQPAHRGLGHIRRWSTSTRITTVPTQKKDELKSAFRKLGDFDDIDGIEQEEVGQFIKREKKNCPELRTRILTNYVHETIFESKDSDFFWFRPNHRRALRRDVDSLEKIISGMTGHKAYLKPDHPPQEMLQLLPKMSASTEIERDLILTSLRLYQDVLRVKDLSSVNTEILAKEMGNPKGMSSALNLVLNASKHSGKQLLMKNTARQVQLHQAKQRTTEMFMKSAGDLRLMKKDTAKHNATMLDFKYEYEAEKRKDEHAICTKFDTIASALYSQRRFWEMWNYQDGPVEETYKDVCKIFSDRAKRIENKRQLSNPEAHAKLIDKKALAYADAQIRKGSDLIYNNEDLEDDALDAQQKSALDKRAVFTFRDEPEETVEEMCHLTLEQLKERRRRVYRQRRPRSAG